jgi:hypothetical protein
MKVRIEPWWRYEVGGAKRVSLMEARGTSRRKFFEFVVVSVSLRAWVKNSMNRVLSSSVSKWVGMGFKVVIPG